MGEPDDQYEQEADQVATQVMRMSEGDFPIQRKCNQCEEEEVMQRKELIGVPSIQADFNNSLQGTKGGGTSLPGNTRQFMESRIGADFSNVRIHTGNTSEKMNRDISARAFTHGSDIYFNRNEYQPESNTGKELLAHELTHVIQQKSLDNTIQLVPGGEREEGIATLHERLGRQYSRATGVPYTPGIQYTEGYTQWLAEQSETSESDDNPDQVCLTASFDDPEEMICVDRPADVTEEGRVVAMREALDHSWERFMEYINESGAQVHFLILRLADALNEDDILLTQRILSREDPLRQEPLNSIARRMIGVKVADESLRVELMELTNVAEPDEFEETAGRGESYYRDEVPEWSIERGENRITGDVERSEYSSEEAFAHGNRRIHFGRVSLELIQNEDQCVLRLPVTINVVPHTEGTNTFCGDVNHEETDEVNTPDPSRVEEVRADYIRILNDRLNGWYSVQLEEECEELNCESRNIPIEVNVSHSTSNPDFTVIVTNNSGRSYVGGTEVVLCTQNLSDETMWHEGGHMVLEHGDEYPEEGRPEQRVRTDMSLMGSHSSYGRFAVLHRRHFNFARVFIEHVTGCPATLREEPRPIQISFRPSLFLGGSAGQITGLYYSIGLEMGIPLDRLRRFEIIMGPRLNYIMSTDARTSRIHQLLLGFRAGIQGSIDPLLLNVPLTVGGYGEFGGVGITDLDTGEFGTEPYVEGGLTLGGSMGELFNFGIEGGVGTRFDSDDESPYFRFGAYVGGSF
jgi:hypothetical protein